MANENNNLNVIASEERAKQSAASQPSLRGDVARNEAKAISSKEPKKLIPKLRFKEFEGEWEKVDLGTTCTVKTGGSDTQDRVDDGKYPFFVRSNTVERINSYSFDGEAILTSGDGVGVGKNFHYINGKFDFHQRVYALHSFKEGYSGKFIYQVFVEKFYKRVMRLSAKNSVDSVRMSMITEMKMGFPNLPEQQKIANFLTAVDTKLQQLTTKKETLEQYKKGVMQQLFSQQLRFKPDVIANAVKQSHEANSKQSATNENQTQFPDWDKLQLSDLAERVKTKNKIDNQNVLTISAQLGLVSQLEYFNKSVSAKNLTGYYLLERNDFAYNKSYSNGYPMGAIKRLNKYDFGVVSTLYICFRFNKKVSLDFMEQYFEFGLQNREIEKVAQEGARNHGLLNIGVNDFFDIDMKIPSLKEQQKIATYLSAIDKKIEAVQTQISNTQAFKKGLLQQMFV